MTLAWKFQVFRVSVAKTFRRIYHSIYHFMLDPEINSGGRIQERGLNKKAADLTRICGKINDMVYTQP